MTLIEAARSAGLAPLNLRRRAMAGQVPFVVVDGLLDFEPEDVAKLKLILSEHVAAPVLVAIGSRVNVENITAAAGGVQI